LQLPAQMIENVQFIVGSSLFVENAWPSGGFFTAKDTANLRGDKGKLGDIIGLIFGDECGRLGGYF